jgi:lipoyl(octanoyl) transferase
MMKIEWCKFNQPVAYEQALQMMEQHVNDIIFHSAPERVLLLEHPHIYTAGTSAAADELIADMAPVIYTGRGGKITYHGPGQKVIYPILNLNLPHRIADIRGYIQDLQQWIINSLRRINIDAYIMPGMVGVWVDAGRMPAKICAIGIRARKWVTYHGVALNVKPDLTYFTGIVPCGLKDYHVTSIAALGVDVADAEIDLILKEEFQKIFTYS